MRTLLFLTAFGLPPLVRQVVAVNGKAYSAEILREAIKATTNPQHRRIDLLIDNEGRGKSQTAMAQAALTYGEGEKYPVLERDATKTRHAFKDHRAADLVEITTNDVRQH